MTLHAGEFMQLWGQSDQDSERKLQKMLEIGLDVAIEKGSDVINRVKQGPALAGPVKRWMHERDYPSSVTGQLTVGTGGDPHTITFSGQIFGTTMTSELIKRCIRVGTILERYGDNFQIKITDVTGLAGSAPFTAEGTTHGGTTAYESTDSAGVPYTIISEVWYDMRDFDQSRNLDRAFRKVGCQIHAEGFQIPQTRKNTKYEVVPNEVEHQLTALIRKLKKQLSFAVLRGMPVVNAYGAPIYGDETQESMMCGIMSWPQFLQVEESNPLVYVPMAGQEVTVQNLDKLIRDLWLTENADFDSGSWYIVCHPNTHSYIHYFESSRRRTTNDATKAGVKITDFDAQIGKTFPILTDRWMRPHELAVVNLANCEWGYYANDQIQRKELATQGRYQNWLISFQTYGVVFRNPRQSIAMMTGLPTAALE